MAQDLKISQLAVQPINIPTSGSEVDVSDIIQSGKFFIPAAVVEGTSNIQNKSLDIGLIFNLFKLYIDQAAAQAVQDYRDQGNVSPGGSGGGSEGGGGSEDYTMLANQINQLRQDIYNPSNYPVTYIRLVAGNEESNYQISTGLGQTSQYTEQNPIIIHTTDITPDDVYVTFRLGDIVVNQGVITTQVTVTIYSEYNNKIYQGCSAGSLDPVKVRVMYTTNNGQYETSAQTNALSAVALDSSTTSATTTLQLSTNTNQGGISVSLATVTCEIGGKAISGSGYKTGTTNVDGTGTIKF